MTHTVLYSGEFDWQSFRRLGTTERERIQSAIHGKLEEFPEKFGKPLRYSLKGHRSLRVGDYRVLFMIRRKTVIILSIAHRGKVY